MSDDAAPPLPTDPKLVDTIEKTAACVRKSTDAKGFERVIQQKNNGKGGWGFLEEGGTGWEYYQFCKHCQERQVDPRPLALQARKAPA